MALRAQRAAAAPGAAGSAARSNAADLLDLRPDLRDRAPKHGRLSSGCSYFSLTLRPGARRRRAAAGVSILDHQLRQVRPAAGADAPAAAARPGARRGVLRRVGDRVGRATALLLI